MNWISPHVALGPTPGRFTSVRLIDQNDAGREEVESFIAAVYLDRYGARLRRFLPHLLAYYDTQGRMAAAVGLRAGEEGRLFAEQYLTAPVEQVMARRGIARVDRARVVEVGNFAAASPGVARELIVQVACILNAAQRHWVLFVATKQLRNAFLRLNLSTIDLAEASADHLEDLSSDWGDYYASRPRLMCGNIIEGVAFLRQEQAAIELAAFPELCLTGSS